MKKYPFSLLLTQLLDHHLYTFFSVCCLWEDFLILPQKINSFLKNIFHYVFLMHTKLIEFLKITQHARYIICHIHWQALRGRYPSQPAGDLLLQTSTVVAVTLLPFTKESEISSVKHSDCFLNSENARDRMPSSYQDSFFPPFFQQWDKIILFASFP